MKIPRLLLGAILLACVCCAKDEPTEYPVTMRLKRVVPTSDYQLYAGGQKVDDPQEMARFRDQPRYIWTNQGILTESWKEPDGAQFDRIDFPDKSHSRMLWTKGGETAFDITQEQGLLKMKSQERALFFYDIVDLSTLFRYDINAFYWVPAAAFAADDCYWGRFTSDRQFEMLWTQIRWRSYLDYSDPFLISDELFSISNTIDESKIGAMGPNDTLVVRHYKVIFTR